MAETIRQSDIRNNNAARFLPAAEFDALIAGAGPGPDPCQWARNMAEFDEFVDDGPADPWDRASSP